MKKLFVVSVLFIFLTACQLKDYGKVTIIFWAMGAEAEYLEKLTPEFENQNPGIKVKIQQIPWTAAQEKLITAYASDNTPDACQLGNTWIPQFVALEAIQVLDSLVTESNEIKESNYFEGIWNTNVIEEAVYGIPWYIDTRVLFYRKDVFEKAGFDSPPKTWDELYRLSKRIKKNAKDEGKYAIYLPTNEWAPFIIFGLQANSSLLKENNSYGDFSGKEFKQAFEYLINFHKEKLAPIGISQVNNVYQAFAEEYFSMYISGPWNIREFKRWMKDDLADKWATAPLPGLNENIPGVSLAGGSSLVMFKNSKKKKQIWKFFEYLSKPETQIKFYKLINNLPAVKKAWQDSTFAGDKYIKAFYEQFHHVVATPKIPEWEQIVFSKLQQYAEIAAREVMTVEEALKAMDKDVNKILEKRRWLLRN